MKREAIITCRDEYGADNNKAIKVYVNEEGYIVLARQTGVINIHPDIPLKELFNAIRYVKGLKTR